MAEIKPLGNRPSVACPMATPLMMLEKILRLTPTTMDFVSIDPWKEVYGTLTVTKLGDRSFLAEDKCGFRVYFFATGLCEFTMNYKSAECRNVIQTECMRILD